MMVTETSRTRHGKRPVLIFGLRFLAAILALATGLLGPATACSMVCWESNGNRELGSGAMAPRPPPEPAPPEPEPLKR